MTIRLDTTIVAAYSHNLHFENFPRDNHNEFFSLKNWKKHLVKSEIPTDSGRSDFWNKPHENATTTFHSIIMLVQSNVSKIAKKS